MSPRTSPPFRADHVGSLLRPPEVKAARESHQAGTITAQRLREVEDDAIRSNVEMQKEVGLQAVTDGEIRRQSWHMDFIYQLGGVSRVAEGQTVEFRTLGGETIISAQGALRVDGKVSLEHAIFGEDFTMLASVAAPATPKLTIPSVNMIYSRGGRAAIDEDAYPELEEFWSDLVAAYGEELQRLEATGALVVILDEEAVDCQLAEQRLGDEVVAALR